MNSYKNSAPRSRGALGQFSARIWLWLAMLTMAGFAYAAAPPAGTTIGNQASATYQDDAGITRSTTSNLVETTVAQVAGISLTAPQTVNSAPGTTVYFPHTVTNTGNGADKYNLSAAANPLGAGVDYVLTNVVIYPDADGNGVPDNFTPITVTPTTLNPGQSYKFIVAATVPPSATTSQVGKLHVDAASQFNLDFPRFHRHLIG